MRAFVQTWGELTDWWTHYDAETLAARVLAVEHPLYLHVLRLLAAGRLREQAGQLLLDGHPAYTPLSLESAHS